MKPFENWSFVLAKVLQKLNKILAKLLFMKIYQKDDEIDT